MGGVSHESRQAKGTSRSSHEQQVRLTVLSLLFWCRHRALIPRAASGNGSRREWRIIALLAHGLHCFPCYVLGCWVPVPGAGCSTQHLIAVVISYFFFSSTPSCLSVAAMSSAEVAGFTVLSMAVILPSLPM